MAVRFGIHTALWLRSWQEPPERHFERAARLGFDGVEVSLVEPGAVNPHRLRKAAEGLGLALTFSTGLGPAHDLCAADPDVRRRGLERLRQAIDVTAAAGSDLLCGVLYAAWKVVGHDTGARARSVEALQDAGERAQRRGVRLALECLNRFETDVINTVDQGVEFVRRVDRPSVGLLADAFHMNIEERDVAAALQRARPHLFHVHCAETDRGRPGAGHFPWPAFFQGLAAIAYDGWMTMECFVDPDTPISGDWAVWRTIDPDADRVAAEGLAFLKGQASAAGIAI